MNSTNPPIRPTRFDDRIATLLREADLPLEDLSVSAGPRFFTCSDGNELLGAVALELLGEVALLRSLAVAPAHRGRGLGDALLAHAERHAADQGVSELYLLTTTAERFFAGRGYARAERASAPRAIVGTKQFADICPASAAFMAKRVASRSAAAPGPGPATGPDAAARIRPATLLDAAEVARLSTQLGYPASAVAMHERLEQLLASPLHVVIVAEGGHGLLGWVTGELRLILESGPRVELAGLVVDASARRSGIGRRLVREVEQWALAKGCGALFVRSNVARGEAHPFYEQLGYERVKTQHAYRKLVG